MQYYVFQNECNRLRDRLEDEVDEEKMRALVKENFEFIDQLWEGKIESTRYTAYKKGGDTRNGLIYRIMTSAFSDNHYKWMMDEITVSIDQMIYKSSEFKLTHQASANKRSLFSRIVSVVERYYFSDGRTDGHYV